MIITDIIVRPHHLTVALPVRQGQSDLEATLARTLHTCLSDHLPVEAARAAADHAAAQIVLVPAVRRRTRERT